MQAATLEQPKAASPEAPAKVNFQARATTRENILAEIEAQEARNWGGCSLYMDGCNCQRCRAGWERAKAAWHKLDLRGGELE